MILDRDTATRLRAVRMRTYKVVPLAPTAGVLQWVENTVPLSYYLTGPMGAHRRYREHDISHKDARAMLTDVHKVRPCSCSRDWQRS